MTVISSLMMMFMTIWTKIILICLTEEERAELANAFKDDRVVMNWMMKTCHCFLLGHILSVQSYGANIVYIYDRDGAWITLK